MEISINTPMPNDGNCQVIEHLEARPLRARRGWSAEAKARLVEKTLVPGANVSAIARGAGMAPAPRGNAVRAKSLLLGSSNELVT